MVYQYSYTARTGVSEWVAHLARPAETHLRRVLLHQLEHTRGLLIHRRAAVHRHDGVADLQSTHFGKATASVLFGRLEYQYFMAFE